MPLPQSVHDNSVGTIITDSDLADLTNRDYTGVTNTSEAGTGGNLVFSDNPENVPASDINRVLCSSPISAGSYFRIYVDHVNSAGSMQEVNVWVQNTNSTGTATVTAYATGEGLNGYNQMVQYMTDLIKGPTPTVYHIPAGPPVAIAGMTLANTANICLVWDLYTDTSIKVYTTFGSNVNFSSTAPFVTSSQQHTRGTFPGMNIDKTLSTPLVIPWPSGYKTIPVGGDYSGSTEVNTYRNGTDYTTTPSVPRTGTTADYGIFGMLYSIEIPVSNSASYPMCVGVVLNERVSPLDGVVGDIGAGTVVHNSPAMTSTDQGMIVSKTLLSPGASVTKRFYWMIPSGDSTPAQFVIVPYSGTCGP